MAEQTPAAPDVAGARPAPEQPGTLAEQLEAVDLYLVTPWRRTDPAGAWELARRLVMSHAREREGR